MPAACPGGVTPALYMAPTTPAAVAADVFRLAAMERAPATAEVSWPIWASAFAVLMDIWVCESVFSAPVALLASAETSDRPLAAFEMVGAEIPNCWSTAAICAGV